MDVKSFDVNSPLPFPKKHKKTKPRPKKEKPTTGRLLISHHLTNNSDFKCEKG